MTPYDLILGCLIFAASAHFISIAVLLARPCVRRPSVPDTRPPVTILRPATGIENNIEETLASAFAIDYPEFEIVFCVQDTDDPVIPLVERLMAAHGHVPSRLLVGDDRISINPKLNNLVKGWRAARYDWIVMADSNVLIPPNYLDDLLARWTDEVGLVCSPPVGTRPDGVGAELECAFLNTYQARWQLTADAFGIGFAQGKTMLWRRDILDRAGGIAALASEPAEDAASTKVVKEAGYRVRLVRNPYPQPLGYRPLAEIWRRQLRWARLRRATFAPLYATELISGGFLPLTAAAILIALGPPTWPAFVALFAGWYGAELLLAVRMGWPVSPRIALLLLARDLSLPILWIAGWTGNTFVWRGNAMDMDSMLATRPPRRLSARWGSARVARSFRSLAASMAPAGVLLRTQALQFRAQAIQKWKTGIGRTRNTPR
jgi:ceramide glucosyltransferase